MASNLLSRGDIFAGRYRIERAIGAGGMGAVFEAEHLETERPVALKVLLPHSLVSDTARERFKQEARVAGKIRHPHIVDVLDAGVDDVTNMPYLVMELLHGEDLGSRVERLGPMTPEETVTLLAQVASALDCLHERSIVHRDLKPENLFLTWAEDGSPVMKLLDFGVAKVIAEGKTSALTQDAQGTPVYMAPEQFAEQIRISAATDIYALGLVAFSLLTGKHYWGPEIERGMNVFMLARIAEAGPREPASQRAIRQGAALPAAFDEWFSIITAIEPGQRYPTAGDAIEVLADVLGVPVGAPVPSMRRSRTNEAPPPAAPDPLPEKGAIASTPPIPLQRAVPFWRRPTMMTAGLLGVACLMAYGILLAPHLGPTALQGRAPELPASAASARAPSPAPSSSSAAVTAPPAPSDPPAPSGLATDSTLSAAASAPSSTSTAEPPDASTPASAPSSGAPPEGAPSAPPAGSASRRPVPRVPAPVTTKRPRYTRE